MTEHQHEDFELLEQAVEAFETQALDLEPPLDLVTSTVEVLQAKENSSAHLTSADSLGTERDGTTRRELMFRFAKYGSLGTAAAIGMVALGSMFGIFSARPALAQVIQNVREATGARYTLRQKIGNQRELTMRSSFNGNLIRTEVPDQFVMLANVQTREMLHLIPSMKQAFRGQVDGVKIDGPISIAQIMREVTEDSGEVIETINQDGQLIDVYDVKELPEFFGQGKLTDTDRFRMWVDRKNAVAHTDQTANLRRTKKQDGIGVYQVRVEPNV